MVPLKYLSNLQKTLEIPLNDCEINLIHVKETITVPKTGTAAAPNNSNKNVILKNCALFTDCISEIINAQFDNAKDIDVAIPIYSLIEYSDIYSKTSGSLWQYY